MLEVIPDAQSLTTLVGESLYETWNALRALIEERYDMDCAWGKGGKAWTYEYKYRRGGKTLCALYAREHCIGFMVILGKDERYKFEQDRAVSQKGIFQKFGRRFCRYFQANRGMTSGKAGS